MTKRIINVPTKLPISLNLTEIVKCLRAIMRSLRAIETHLNELEKKKEDK
jgi:hypothetical protein